jgi:tetratricopeptide (TPR) repeat protein
MPKPGSPDYGSAFSAALASVRRAPVERLTREQVVSLCDGLLARGSAAQELILRNSRLHRHADVCRGLLERSHQARHRDLQAMLTAALAAVRVANQLEDRPELPTSLRIDLWVQAHVSLANALRANDRLGAAERFLRRAQAALEEGSGDPLVSVRLYFVKGALAVDRRRYREAAPLFARASRLYETLGDAHAAAEVAVARGRLAFFENDHAGAVKWLVSALRGIEPGRDPHLLVGTLQALCWTLDEAGQTPEAILLLREAYPLFDYTSHDILGLRVRWLEGRLLARVGRLGDAAMLLESVRQAFVKLDLAYDASLAALHVAEVHLRLGLPERVEQLVVEMLPVFASEQLHDEVRKALALLEVASRQRCLDASTLERARRGVERAPARRRR